MKKIVVICSNEKCKSLLEEAGKSLGYEIMVETQINEVVNNEVSEKDIKEAMAVLFATDGTVEDIEKIERFIDCEYYEVEPQYIISDAVAVLKEIISDIN